MPFPNSSLNKSGIQLKYIIDSMSRSSHILLFLMLLILSTHQECVGGAPDGELEDDEQCDTNGETAGCTATCEVKNLYKCSYSIGSLSVCRSICGDGIVDRKNQCDGSPVTFGPIQYWCKITAATDDEQCDTQGTTAGCSQCKVQNLYKCNSDVTQTTLPQSVCVLTCNDGILDRCPSTITKQTTTTTFTYCRMDSTSDHEECDMNIDTVACKSCKIQNRYQCIQNEVDEISVCIPLCKDGIIQKKDDCDNPIDDDCRIDSAADNQECDTGSTVSAGCMDCKVTNLWKCHNDGTEDTPTEDDPKTTQCNQVCSDGFFDFASKCDGSQVEQLKTTGSMDDKIKKVCRIQSSFQDEECDNGGGNGDGCSDTCKVQNKYKCQNDQTEYTSDCSPLCKDGKLDSTTTCFGQKYNFEYTTGDTSTYRCRIETQADNQQCDSGTTTTHCEQCKLKDNTQCINDRTTTDTSTTSQSTCGPTCGDSIVDTLTKCNSTEYTEGSDRRICKIDADEQCDFAGAGCTNDCKIQDTYFCGNGQNPALGTDCKPLSNLCGLNQKLDFLTCDKKYVQGIACASASGFYEERCDLSVNPLACGDQITASSTRGDCRQLNLDYWCDRSTHKCTKGVCKNGIVDTVGTCAGTTYFGNYICNADAALGAFPQQCDRAKFCTDKCKDTRPDFADDIKVPSLPPIPNNGDVTIVTSVCGNGKRQGDEQCDTQRGLGCVLCKKQPGYTCSNDGTVCTLTSPPTPTPTPLTCGNAVKEGTEQCDNGNNLGCSRNCVIDKGFECKENSQKLSVCTVKQTSSSCGNGVVEKGEACDNGNAKGCTNCVQDAGYSCTAVVGSKSTCVKGVCGDFIRRPGEDCDNGNNAGCIGCKINKGYTCIGGFGVVSLCSKIPVCGNGDWEPSNREQCDDNNNTPLDGCDEHCQIEYGWSCRAPRLYQLSICHRISSASTVCGNEILQGNERCDDGNTSPGDGCSSTCTIEPGFNCTLIAGTRKSFCMRLAASAVCGDYIIQGGEKCDDGDQDNGDGCSSRCQVEKGWGCGENIPKFVSQCIKVCGNGWFEPRFGEQCDDGDNDDGDGCSALCEEEAGASCQNVEGQTSICF